MGASNTSQKIINATSPVHQLTEQQRVLVDCLMKGMNTLQAARAAGYSHPEKAGYQAVNSPKVQAALQYLHKRHEKKADMSRKKVMDGFLEAIEMAKIQGEAGVMVNGWREIGRMCGYYAPETKKIDINITAKRVIDKLETLSDEELAEMIEESATIIEGEAEEVLDSLQAASDASLTYDPDGGDFPSD